MSGEDRVKNLWSGNLAIAELGDKSSWLVVKSEPSPSIIHSSEGNMGDREISY